jgi:hypothetical protein
MRIHQVSTAALSVALQRVRHKSAEVAKEAGRQGSAVVARAQLILLLLVIVILLEKELTQMAVALPILEIHLLALPEIQIRFQKLHPHLPRKTQVLLRCGLRASRARRDAIRPAESRQKILALLLLKCGNVQ